MKTYVCEYCGIYSAAEPKCNKCEEEVDNGKAEEIENMTMGIMRAYPHPSFSIGHAKMIAEYLVENPMGKPVGSKDRFEVRDYGFDDRSSDPEVVPIDYR